MNIVKLKEGTRLVWDAPSHRNDSSRIIYPVLIGHKHHRHPWVMVYTNSGGQWMGPESEFMREPTQEETRLLKWPDERTNFRMNQINQS